MKTPEIKLPDKLRRKIELLTEDFPRIVEMERQGRVNYDVFDCGAYKCAWGWVKSWRPAVNELDIKLMWDFNLAAQTYYGFTTNDVDKIFGGEECGPTEDRIKYLQDLIHEELQVLGVG